VFLFCGGGGVVGYCGVLYFEQRFPAPRGLFHHFQLTLRYFILFSIYHRRTTSAAATTTTTTTTTTTVIVEML
jgi:hypothetical protein